jgi:putative ABC transport system permease protein
MLRNYFRIAVRNLWRNKTFSAINFAKIALPRCAFQLQKDVLVRFKPVKPFAEPIDRLGVVERGNIFRLYFFACINLG